MRPILEYACPAWHYSLTVAWSDVLVSLQKRAIRTIFFDADYDTSLIIAGIDTLRDGREVLTARFFKRQVISSSSLLHYLLPVPDPDMTILSMRNRKPFYTQSQLA